jgi:hypothetical protein
MGFRAGYWLLYGCQVTSPDKKQKKQIIKTSYWQKKTTYFTKPFSEASTYW